MTMSIDKKKNGEKMKGKKFWITECVLACISFVLLFVVLSSYNNCDGHVSLEKRDNVLSNLNVINIFSEKTVIEDFEGNLYIGNMSGDSLTVQKYTGQGKYICSYYVYSKYRIYGIDENSRFYIYNDEMKYWYEGEQLVDVTEVSWKESFDSQYMEQKSDGKVIFWTVKLNNGKNIKLQKNLSFNMDYSNMLILCIELILLIAITSKELEKAAKSFGVNEANQRDWGTIIEKTSVIVNKNTKWSEKNVNWLLKKIHLSIHSSYSVGQVQEVLNKNVMKNTNKIEFSIHKEYPFYGMVEQDTFEMVLNTDNRNSFYPIVKGKFTPENDAGGTIINIDMEMPFGTRCIIVIWVVVSFFIFGMGVVRMNAGESFLECFPLLSGSLVAFLFEEIVSRTGFYKDSKIIIKKLNILFYKQKID